MNLAELKNLDINNVGAWPLPIKGVAFVLMFCAVLGIGYWFESQGQLPDLDKARQQEKDLKDVFKTKAAKAANLEAYKQQLEEMKQSFGAMLRQLPNKTQVADLLVDISQAGLASGLEFELFKPEAEIPKDFYAELPITIRVKGHYHDFGAFVSGVAALPRIVTLHDINIKPATAEKDKGKDGSRLVMDLTAKTYRYIEEEGAK